MAFPLRRLRFRRQTPGPVAVPTPASQTAASPPPTVAPDAGAAVDGEPTVAPADEAALAHRLRALELTIRARMDGVLRGNYTGLLPGPGSEPGEAREYQAGDDVRHMDWAVTARTQSPHIRQTVADYDAEVWVVVDLSPSLNVGSAATSKRDRAIEAAAAFIHIATMTRNQVGLIIATGAGIVERGLGTSRAHANALIATLLTTASAPDTAQGLDAALRTAALRQRRRGLTVVVSDFLTEVTWEKRLRLVATRHDLIAVRVTDPLDIELPAAGELLLADAATGERMRVATTAKLRADYADAAAAHRAQVSAALLRHGGRIMELSTAAPWLRAFVQFVVSQRRLNRGAASV